MDKQAAIIALDECINGIEAFGQGAPIRLGATMTERTAWANIRVLKERAITGMKIAMRILNESEKAEEIQIHIVEVQADGNQQKSKRTCPHCGNEEISPGAKWCQICGLPLFVSKN